MRQVAWPSRPTTIFNTRVVLMALGAIGVGIAAVNLATGGAIDSLIH